MQKIVDSDMTNENEILKRIRAKVGLEMTRSADFDVLSQSIKDTTNENLGVNTLKRLFGFKTEKVVPRLSGTLPNFRGKAKRMSNKTEMITVI